MRDELVDAVDGFGGRVRVLTIYIAEAHAREEWPIGEAHSNGGVLSLAQAKSLAERRAAARIFEQQLAWPFAIYVDGMGDAFEATFAAWPLRFFVVAADGQTIAHVAHPEPGQYTYSPASLIAPLRAALDACVAYACDATVRG